MMKNRTSTFTIKLVTQEKVLNLLQGLNGSKATGIDYIDTKTLKLVATIIAPALTHVINTSINTSTYPDCYKWAKVVPLLKSQSLSPLAPKSYRPVSLLPVLSRVHERAIFGQFSGYLDDNGLLHHNHHGGRPGHNTATAVLQLHDQMLENAENGMMTGMMMTDLSAAFDLCSHVILLKKLCIGYGVTNSSINWFNSYLSNRYQSCMVDGSLSMPLPVSNCSLPQGSVGAPVLFLIYTNELPNVIHQHDLDYNKPTGYCVECGDMVNFVDDGTVIVGSKDPNKISVMLRRHYDNIEEWIHSNQMVINPDKTHYLVCAPRSMAVRRKEVILETGGHIIDQSESEVLLGIRMHQSLSWNSHVRDGKGSVLSQIKTRVNGLKKLAARADFNTKLMIANGSVMSKLRYGICVWGNCQRYLLKALQVQQLTAARTICGYKSFYWSTAKLLNTCKWLSIHQTYVQQVCIAMYRMMTSGRYVNIYEYIRSHFSY